MSEEIKSKPVKIFGPLHFGGGAYREVFLARIRLAVSEEFNNIRRLEEGTAIVEHEIQSSS